MLIAGGWGQGRAFPLGGLADCLQTGPGRTKVEDCISPAWRSSWESQPLGTFAFLSGLHRPCLEELPWGSGAGRHEDQSSESTESTLPSGPSSSAEEL